MNSTRKNNFYLLVIWLFLAIQTGYSQTVLNREKNYLIDYTEFIHKLSTQNLSHLAELYNLKIADAEIKAASILPDPEISFGVHDNQQKRMRLGYGFEVELEWDLELGGKRKARKKLATAEKNLTQIEIDYEFDKLKAEATLIFMESLVKKEELTFHQDLYRNIQEIIQIDSNRLENGEIKKSDFLILKKQFTQKQKDLLAIQSEWENILADLKLYISTEKHDTTFIPMGNLRKLTSISVEENPLQSAEKKSFNIELAQQKKEVSQQKIELAKAERIMDIGLYLGIENNAFEQNIIGPTPGLTSVFAGITIPIQFSNNKESGLPTALFEKEQALLQYTHEVLQWERETAKAYHQYRQSKKILELAESNLDEAELAYQEELKNYSTKKYNLAELITLQKLYEEAQTAYSSDFMDYIETLVELKTHQLSEN